MNTRKKLFDPILLFTALSLVGIGLVMVTSSSLTVADNWHLPSHYFAVRQGIAFAIGLLAAMIFCYVPMNFWQKISLPLLFASLFLLILLLVPGVSRVVNGSVRWIFIGPMSFQISEYAKLAFIIYISSYLVRHEEEVRNRISGFLKPLALLGLISLLLLMEPDFGAAVVIVCTALGMLFLGGVPITRFLVLLLLAGGALAVLSFSSPYRMARLTAFLNPWADQFNTGYQLTQSLIAFGRGGWLGTGLGNSVQKLLYLPEPHTDFLYAVLAEELGLIGALLVLILFSIAVFRILSIGRRALLAENPFSAYIAYGIALWIGMQTFINIGVNVGMLPTKGLTLPLMSYGGSSMIAGLIALGILFRIDFESRLSLLFGLGKEDTKIETTNIKNIKLLRDLTHNPI